MTHVTTPGKPYTQSQGSTRKKAAVINLRKVPWQFPLEMMFVLKVSNSS